jgi:hypothetical protein
VGRVDPAWFSNWTTSSSRPLDRGSAPRMAIPFSLPLFPLPLFVLPFALLSALPPCLSPSPYPSDLGSRLAAGGRCEAGGCEATRRPRGSEVKMNLTPLSFAARRISPLDTTSLRSAQARMSFVTPCPIPP